MSNHDEYRQGMSAGWRWAYHRLRLGILTLNEVINESDKLHPLAGFSTGMRRAIHDWQEEHPDEENEDEQS